MKLLQLAGSISLLLMVLVGCGQAEEKEESAGEEVSMEEAIEVNTEMPENPDPKEEIELAAVVTQGGEKVADADEVRFEIWKDGEKDSSEETLAENREENRYSITTTFENEGLYHVTAHVTARGMHNMPTEDITIGSPDAGEEKDDAATDGSSESSLETTLQSEDISVGKPTEITFQVQHDGQKLTGARVRFEIQKGESGTPTWMETEETDAGVYTGTHIFEASGEYTITVHAENEEGLHEHQEQTLTVE